jgi:hypothetical protein
MIGLGPSFIPNFLFFLLLKFPYLFFFNSFFLIKTLIKWNVMLVLGPVFVP